jgi:hypothetical protein
MLYINTSILGLDRYHFGKKTDLEVPFKQGLEVKYSTAKKRNIMEHIL